MATIFKRDGKAAAKGSSYVVSWYDHEAEKWRQRKGFTDADLSRALGQRLELESAARREGFTTAVRTEANAPIAEQVEQFILHLRSKQRVEYYVAQMERRISRVVAETGAKRLADLNAGKVEAALMRMKSARGFQTRAKPLSVATRNEYVTSLQTFTKWATKRRKVDFDPLASLEKADELGSDRVHPRRALAAADLAKLLDAARDRPEYELRVVRTGGHKGELRANVRPGVLGRARATGVARRMAYLLAIWTGLRRSELRQLQWGDVWLDVEVPYLQLRDEATKSRRADVLPLHAQVADELRAFRPAAAAATDPVLPEVPMMAVMKRDLAHAGIAYGDRETGYADLHSMRTTLNTLLASHDVAPRTRQSQLRHGDPRLTEVTYFDKSRYLEPHAKQLNRAAAIGERDDARSPDAAAAMPPGQSSRKGSGPDRDWPASEAEAASGSARSRGDPIGEQKGVGRS